MLNVSVNKGQKEQIREYRQRMRHIVLTMSNMVELLKRMIENELNEDVPIGRLEVEIAKLEIELQNLCQEMMVEWYIEKYGHGVEK